TVCQDSIVNIPRLPVKISNGFSFYSELHKVAYKYRDSLTKWETAGSFFVRFTVNKDQYVENVVFSSTAPLFMVKLLDTCIIGAKFEIDGYFPANLFFVIPITYSFEGRKPSSVEEWDELFDYLGVNADKLGFAWGEKYRQPFERFFDFDIDKTELAGSLCIMLPWTHFGHEY